MDLISDGILPNKPLEDYIPLHIIDNNNMKLGLDYKESTFLEHIKKQFGLNSSYYYDKNAHFTVERLNKIITPTNLTFYYSATEFKSQTDAIDYFLCSNFHTNPFKFKSKNEFFYALPSLLWTEDSLKEKHLLGCITIHKKYITAMRKRILKKKLLPNHWFTIFIDNKIKDYSFYNKITSNPLYSVLKVVYTNSILKELYSTVQWQLTQEDKDIILKELSSMNLDI